MDRIQLGPSLSRYISSTYKFTHAREAYAVLMNNLDSVVGKFVVKYKKGMAVISGKEDELSSWLNEQRPGLKLKSHRGGNQQSESNNSGAIMLEEVNPESLGLGISVYLHKILSFEEYGHAFELIKEHMPQLDGKIVSRRGSKKGGRLIAGKEEELKEWLRNQEGYEFNFKDEKNTPIEEENLTEWYSRNRIVKQLGYEPSGPASVFIGELVEKGKIPAKYIRRTGGHYKISSEAIDKIDKHLTQEGYRKVEQSSVRPMLPVHTEEPDKKTLPGMSLDKLLEKIGAKKEAKERIISMLEGDKKDYAILPYFRKRNGEYELVSAADLVLREAARELFPKLDSLKLLG